MARARPRLGALTTLLCALAGLAACRELAQVPPAAVAGAPKCLHQAQGCSGPKRWAPAGSDPPTRFPRRHRRDPVHRRAWEAPAQVGPANLGVGGTLAGAPAARRTPPWYPRLLAASPSTPCSSPPPRPRRRVLTVHTPGGRRVVVDTQDVEDALPPGLRSGDAVRVDGAWYPGARGRGRGAGAGEDAADSSLPPGLQPLDECLYGNDCVRARAVTRSGGRARRGGRPGASGPPRPRGRKGACHTVAAASSRVRRLRRQAVRSSTPPLTPPDAPAGCCRRRPLQW